MVEVEIIRQDLTQAWAAAVRTGFVCPMACPVARAINRAVPGAHAAVYLSAIRLDLAGARVALAPPPAAVAMIRAFELYANGEGPAPTPGGRFRLPPLGGAVPHVAGSLPGTSPASREPQGPVPSSRTGKRARTGVDFRSVRPQDGF